MPLCLFIVIVPQTIAHATFFDMFISRHRPIIQNIRLDPADYITTYAGAIMLIFSFGSDRVTIAQILARI